MLRALQEEREHNTPGQIERVISLIETYESDRYAEDVCRRQAEESRRHLRQLPDTPARAILSEMVDFLIRRAF